MDFDLSAEQRLLEKSIDSFFAGSFPLSRVRDCYDAQLGPLDDLDALPAAVRQVLEQHLAHREFVPVLRRILQVSAPVEPTEWEVETDRGRTRFILNSEDDVRRLGEHRVMVIDARGIRYLLPDTRALDAASQRLIERYL